MAFLLSLLCNSSLTTTIEVKVSGNKPLFQWRYNFISFCFVVYQASNLLNQSSSEYPKLSDCHEHIFFKWMPCFVLWSILPLWIYSLSGKHFFKVKITWSFVLKSVIFCNLINISISNQRIYLLQRWQYRLPDKIYLAKWY